MKIFRTILALLIILFIAGCNDDVSEKKTDKNNFDNRALRDIYSNLQRQNSKFLIKTLQSGGKYRADAILSLAAMDDERSAYLMEVYLTDNSPKVRRATVYAIGVLGTNKFSRKLEKLFSEEEDETVKQEILITLGKTGDEHSLTFVSSLEPKTEQCRKGQGLAFYFFVKRGMISRQLIDKAMFELNNPKISEDQKYWYSFFLTVDKNLNLNDYYKVLENEIVEAKNSAFKANLIKGLKHIKDKRSVTLIKKILKSSKDITLKLVALETLKSFPYSSVKNVFIQQLSSEDSRVAETASEFFIDKGVSTEGNLYFTLSKSLNHWQARSNMLMAALKYSGNKGIIAKAIMSGYNVAENRYEKAALLYALSVDTRQYSFVKQQTFSVHDKVVSTAGIKTLVTMRLRKDFGVIASQMRYRGKDLYAEFRLIFKEAMMGGDNAQIYYSAYAVNRMKEFMADEFQNTYFLTQAMKSLMLPRDFKAYYELCRSLSLYGGEHCSEYVNIQPLEIDWSQVQKLNNPLVWVKTNKGTFKIRLDTREAPATVYTFVGLVNSGYYSDTYFYKDIRGKAIVNGGKRGDGWMSMNIPLFKELNMKEFTEGAVAMALNANGYQSLNFFIMTGNEPAYRGKYTVFGQVIEGLDVVKKLKIGDRIIEMKVF